MTNDDLKTVATSDLLAELLERCNPAVFIGTRYEGGLDAGWKTIAKWQGSQATCFGLCHEVAFMIEHPTEDEDDN
jgi:hypothetical protein